MIFTNCILLYYLYVTFVLLSILKNGNQKVYLTRTRTAVPTCKILNLVHSAIKVFFLIEVLLSYDFYQLYIVVLFIYDICPPYYQSQKSKVLPHEESNYGPSNHPCFLSEWYNLSSIFSPIIMNYRNQKAYQTGTRSTTLE